MIIGFERTFRFFFQRQKVKATILFFGGILSVLCGWPKIGMLLEAYGFFLLFGSVPLSIIGLGDKAICSSSEVLFPLRSIFFDVYPLSAHSSSYLVFDKYDEPWSHPFVYLTCSFSSRLWIDSARVDRWYNKFSSVPVQCFFIFVVLVVFFLFVSVWKEKKENLVRRRNRRMISQIESFSSSLFQMIWMK